MVGERVPDNQLMQPLIIQQGILQQAKSHSFAGYDPFDGLNSHLFEYIPWAKKGWFGLAWLQLHKRSPINLRPLCFVPKKRNPKGVALFILGMLQDFLRTNEQGYLEQAIELGDWLLAEQCDSQEWKHSCWGYHFDWNARAFFVPKGKPNAITTLYVAKALFELGQLSGSERFTHAAIDSAHFMYHCLLYTNEQGRQYFCYIPGETAMVHNVNLWVSAWVAKIGCLHELPEYSEVAKQTMRFSLEEQQQDGSWVYGLRHHHQFIDGFHTGYNLEALQILSEYIDEPQLQPAIDKGLQYYKQHLFTAEGRAKYYKDNLYPIDLHSSAQAIITLLRLEPFAVNKSLIERIIQTSIEDLYLPEQQTFAYQKHKLMLNKVQYTRWTQAWAYYSFALYHRILSEHENL